MSNSWIDGGDGTGICCDADADNNLLQLKLKKPKAWKWELTTSRSSPHIAMPRILLFNHEGDLLVDANQQVDDAVYREEVKAPRPPQRRVKKLLRAVTTNLERTLQDDEDTGLGSLDSTDKHSYKALRKADLSYDNTRPREKPLNYRNISGEEVSRTEKKMNGYRPWRNSFPEEMDFGSLQICEATDSDRSAQKSERSPSLLEEDVNINTPWRQKLSQKEKNISPHKKQLEFCSDADTCPDRLYVSKASWKPFHSSGHLDAPSPMAKPFERRASSFKEVRFNVHPPSDEEQHKPKEKRRYRRSNTNGRSPLTPSSSILERFSAMKCRLSSPELETTETHQLQMGPRYFLRTSRAGTIVVAEEILKQKRTRRRPPKTSSTENFLSHSSSSLKRNNNSIKQAGTGLLGTSLGVPCSQSQSMNNFGELNGNTQRRKVMPIRRHRSDGNILQATSSDEESHGNRRSSVRHRKNGSWRQNHGDAKNQTELGG